MIKQITRALGVVLCLAPVILVHDFLPPSSTDPGELLGTWQADLRPTPDAAPYFQPFVVTSVDGISLTGTFYQSEIREGRINADWEGVYFAFVTEDGSGTYHTAGRLINGRMEGTTHALGRNFLSVWTAERATDEK